MRFNIGRGLKILTDICLNIKHDEEVLVVADTNKIEIAGLLALASSERGANVSMTLIDPLPAPGMEPPKPVAAAMLAADAIMMVTTHTLTPSKAREEAQRAGARILSLGGYNYEILLSDALRVDFMSLKPVVEEVANRLTEAESARMVSASGTDIRFRLGNREAHALTNICHEPGTLGSPPDVEAYVAPIEGASEGVVIVDGAICLPEFGLIHEPIKLVIKGGRVVSIEGGKEAERFKNKLQSFDDPNMYLIAELGIGLNPKAKLCGNPLIDEGALGTAHIALGLNFTYGGNIKDAKSHIDCVLKNPTIELDGEFLLRDGELAIDMEG